MFAYKLVPATHCALCNGNLVIEFVGQYGDIHNLSKIDGGVAKRKSRRVMYEHDGEAMVYCPGCGENYDWKYDKDGKVLIKVYDEEAQP